MVSGVCPCRPPPPPGSTWAVPPASGALGCTASARRVKVSQGNSLSRGDRPGTAGYGYGYGYGYGHGYGYRPVSGAPLATILFFTPDPNYRSCLFSYY